MDASLRAVHASGGENLNVLFWVMTCWVADFTGCLVSKREYTRFKGDPKQTHTLAQGHNKFQVLPHVGFVW